MMIQYSIRYNLGTPAFAPHKQSTKSYQNDTILLEKTI